MTENYKSIVAATWVEFVAELKRTVKEGKQNPQRLLYQHSFFKAVMVDGKNTGFAEALDQITGNEVNVLELIDMLYVAASMNNTTEVVVVKPQASTETPEMYVKTEAKTNDSDVDVSLVKSKPQRAKRGSKGGQQ